MLDLVKVLAHLVFEIVFEETNEIVFDITFFDLLADGF